MLAFSPLRRASGLSKRRQRGIAAVELALIAPVLLMLSFGIAEYGRLIYTYHLLVKAVNGAVRIVAVSDYLSEPARSEAQRDAINVVLFGDLTRPAHGQPQVAGLVESMINIRTNVPCYVATCVQVSITGYRYTPMLNVLWTEPVPFREIVSYMRGGT